MAKFPVLQKLTHMIMIELVYFAHRIVYFEANLTKDCLIWQNFTPDCSFSHGYIHHIHNIMKL